MANKSTTSDDEKSSHQQRIDDPWEQYCAARDEAQLAEETDGLVKPLETPTAADGSSAEPVETRIAAASGDRITAALNFVHASDSRDASREWWYLDSLSAEVRRLRDVEIRFKLDEAGITSREKNAVELVELRAEVRRLREELETERMRLAGCGVAALGYFEGCADEYKSASLSDVLRLREQVDLFRTASEAAELRIVELRKELASFVPDETVPSLMRKLARVEGLAKALIDEIDSDEECDCDWDNVLRLRNALRDALRDEPKPTVSIASEEDGGDVDAIALNPLREPKLPYNGY